MKVFELTLFVGFYDVMSIFHVNEHMYFFVHRTGLFNRSTTGTCLKWIAREYPSLHEKNGKQIRVHVVALVSEFTSYQSGMSNILQAEDLLNFTQYHSRSNGKCFVRQQSINSITLFSLPLDRQESQLFMLLFTRKSDPKFGQRE